MKMTLPTDSGARKRYPLRSGLFNYFPAALAGVAKVSMDGNDKHNPGEPLHHARGKSSDHPDCIDRHLTDVEDLRAGLDREMLGKDHKISTEQLLTEVSQLAWRALALSQELHETYGGAPLAPAAKLPSIAGPNGASTVREGFDATRADIKRRFNETYPGTLTLPPGGMVKVPMMNYSHEMPLQRPSGRLYDEWKEYEGALARKDAVPGQCMPEPTTGALGCGAEGGQWPR